MISRDLRFTAMVSRVKRSCLEGGCSLARAAALLALLALLAGCSSLRTDPAPAVVATADPQQPSVSSVPNACSAAVLATLSDVLQRVYGEGLRSERTASAEYTITHSQALRVAVESGDKAAATAAARALLATGHVTNLIVKRDGLTFVDVGGAALAPLQGTLTGESGAPIASYVASVWADHGFLIEAGGVTQSLVALREGGRSIGGSRSLGSSALADEGALTFEGHAYSYTSFPAQAYPSGALRVYVLAPSTSIVPLCGHTSQDTTINTLERVADLIYAGEIGESAHKQIRRMQQDNTLLQAVAHRDPAAAKLAIDEVLNEHVVRMRVSAGGRLLSDVGGPYVLGPVSAPLRLAGRTIGSVSLSIQDDEGYLRLARRLAGMDVLMYMDVTPGHLQLVKNSLGPAPGPALSAVPASGAFHYEGRSFRVFTVPAEAFPSGPLTIRVLVPIPYS
jgi:hypothetical protein